MRSRATGGHSLNRSRPGDLARGLGRARVVVAALGLVSIGRAVSAGDAPTPADSCEIVPKAEVVVIGRTRVLRPAREQGGLSLVRVETEKVLRGTADAAFTLFAGGTQNGRGLSWYAEWSPDGKSWFSSGSKAAEPSSFFPTEGTGRYALFLSPTPNGSGLSLDALFSVDDPEGAEKAAVLEKELKATSASDPAARTAGRLSVLLDLIGSERPWSRLHGARGLEALVADNPPSITPAARQEIEAVLRRSFDEPMKARLRRVLAAAPEASAASGLESSAGSSPASSGAPPLGPDDPARKSRPGAGLPPEYHRAVRRVAEATDGATKVEALSEVARLGKAAAGPDLLAAARGSKEEAARERAIVLLGDVGARETLPPVLELYDRETDPTVREAIVRAVGLLGDGTDVPWLVAQASDPTLGRPLAYALARVRTDPALVALREMGHRARATSPPDDETARLVEYLQTPAFAEAERAAGRVVGPRPLLARTPSAAKPPADRPPDPPCPKSER